MNPRLASAIILAWAVQAIAQEPAKPAAPPAPEPIRYTLKFPDARANYVEVEAAVPTGKDKDHVELMMAVWTPGSYLVREYARQVEGFSARGPDGKPLAWEKSRKNRWKVKTAGAAAATVSYRVYCREMSVRTNWVDAGFALLNGAPTFLTLVDGGKRAHEVSLVLPPGWLKSITALPAAPGGVAHKYVAADFDTLVDSPIVAGNPAVYEFEVDGKLHQLVDEGEGGIFDGPKAAKDVEAIVRANKAFWGSLPYDKYVFFNMLVESGGGLEHKGSTVLMGSRWATRTRRSYLGWLNLVSHEYFHAWNVKRLRPVELGPFDYENEVTTRSLWVAEGVTDYYGRLLVRRAGLCNREEYFGGETDSGAAPGGGGGGDRPSGDIDALQSTPGRLEQPLESASYDAWIKYYRPDENSANTSISYYTKGAVVGFVLDAKVRQATNGAKSLDDVMRLAYSRYSGDAGYTPAQFRAVAQEVAGVDLSAFFARALESTDELDYAEALSWLGLRFKSPDSKPKPKDAEKDKEKDKDKPGPEKAAAEKPVKAWLGIRTRPDAGRLVVSQVRRGSPAYAAGLNVDDEILAINDDRVRPEQWSTRMDQYRPNETASLLISRRDRLMRLDATFAAEPPKVWTLEVLPDASADQKAHLKAWLGE